MTHVSSRTVRDKYPSVVVLTPSRQEKAFRQTVFGRTVLVASYSRMDPTPLMLLKRYQYGKFP